jgi:hypothetical protein
LGKVLFVDEAYRLGQGNFAQEAIDELVDNMTKPKFVGKMVIILAGYENDINNLMRVNEGLSSRFADEISFPSLKPAHCLQLLEDKLKKNQIMFPSMKDPIIYQELLELMAEISTLPSWGNARDVQTLANSMVRAVYQSNTTKVEQLHLPAKVALDCVNSKLSERRARANVIPSSRTSLSRPLQLQHASQQPAPLRSSSTVKPAKRVPLAPKDDDEKPQRSENLEDGRDNGVSDEVWLQLKRDKRLETLQLHKAAQKIKEQEEDQRRAEIAEEEAEKAAAALRVIQAKNEAEALKLSRMREEARIREMEARAERERIQRELDRRRREVEERRKREEVAQSKLRQMGVCVAGFRWTKQAGGYRCAGGSHWVTDSELRM